MSRFLKASALLFFLFILWIVYLANTGSSSIFFDLVRAIPYGDKLGHIALFGTFGLILIPATRATYFKLGFIRIYYGAIAVLGFALIEEISQAFVRSRTFDLLDLAADIVGVILASSLIYLVQRARNINNLSQPENPDTASETTDD
ncbi:VanZ family protein [Microbulbifer sp. VAAF005]|uniref:VanZ family protein n=1 Tax=Microbulbifer sp. VAAF005 TaxID=3034230 RepID=UPI0024ADF6CE|nr:VanZ family protein [Microbulbifer sp. VAAF005]WHI45459.1 VanZ family protein [Microbulbifer sp. VAAF005]